MSSIATTAPPKLPNGVKKPDEEAHKKTLKEINDRINSLQSQMEEVKRKIDKLPAKADNTKRDSLRAQLAELRDKQAEIKKGKQAVYEQLDALNESIRKKVGNIKAFQAKVPYKTVAEVDERVRELEQKIESGVRLVEEKKMLQEISVLKRGRQTVEGLDEQQAAVDREREIYDALRKNIDDSEAKKLSDQYEKINAELKVIQDSQASAREARNKLYDERTRLKGLLDEEYTKLRTVRDEHRKANDEYYTFIRQLREYKREQERIRKQQEELAKRQEVAKNELELASLPAFEQEITICDNLTNFLQGFLSNGTANAAAPLREPDVANLPEGMVLVKKTDIEDSLFAGSGKKKGNKAAKEKKSDTLKLPLATMEAFFEVKVTVPTKISDIPTTLEKLKERKEQYLAEQPKVTEMNKKKAQERYDAMLKKAEEEIAQAAEKTSSSTASTTPSATPEVTAE